jgi:hypothetical protein
MPTLIALELLEDILDTTKVCDSLLSEMEGLTLLGVTQMHLIATMLLNKF